MTSQVIYKIILVSPVMIDFKMFDDTSGITNQDQQYKKYNNEFVLIQFWLR